MTLLFLERLNYLSIDLPVIDFPSFDKNLQIAKYSKIFSQKFQGFVLMLVELIDAKGIDVAQPMWP